jgi:hypothetical protein
MWVRRRRGEVIAMRERYVGAVASEKWGVWPRAYVAGGESASGCRTFSLAWIPTEAKPANKLRGKSKIR